MKTSEKQRFLLYEKCNTYDALIKWDEICENS